MAKTKSRPITPTADLHDLMAQRFPLLPRTKPVCPALHVRLARVRNLTSLAGQCTGESLVRAGEACNLAALIASDSGLPDLAATLCWQQFEAFPTARAYDAPTAKLALQPLINLGRLLIRDGDGDAAYQVLSGLYEAVRGQSDSVIDGRTLTFSGFVRSGNDHAEVVRWLWSILLADGTRALTRAGQWAKALQHAKQHRGIGQRLLDGRQVAILAHAVAGDHKTAFGLLADTDTSAPWEEAVAACMTALCQHLADRPADVGVAAMINSYLELDPVPMQTVFHTRLGLCILDLAAETVDTQRVADAVVRAALESIDAYAAYDALSHPTCHANSDLEISRRLIRIIEASGLRQGALPVDAHGDLIESVNASTASIADTLTRAPKAGNRRP